MFEVAIIAALQTDGQTRYWDWDYSSWKSSRLPEVSIFIKKEKNYNNYSVILSGPLYMEGSLTLSPLGPTGPTGPRSPFRPWNKKYI